MENVDEYGESTLDAIAEAPAFNQWMFDTIRPFLDGKVFEFGSGIGNISDLAINAGLELTVSDLRQNYLSQLQNKLSLDPSRAVKVDMVHPDFEKEYHHLIGQFDAVFALNVVEHIEDHKLAMVNASLLLRTGGKLVVLVPAYQSLYNDFDKELGHYRRFTKNTLKNYIPQNLELLKISYFNAVGILGWYVSGSILKKKEIDKGSMRLYNRMMPIIKLVDSIIFRQVGLSVWVALEKK
ncbi:MAG: methyltransferase [Flavobacteriales bacterium]